MQPSRSTPNSAFVKRCCTSISRCSGARRIETLLDDRVGALLVQLRAISIGGVVKGPGSTVDQRIRDLQQVLAAFVVQHFNAADNRPAFCSPHLSDRADEIACLTT